MKQETNEREKENNIMGRKNRDKGKMCKEMKPKKREMGRR